ncbi:Hypothetical protein LUCI_2272 [Lucifera butyrica]|uniref:HD domain-containing protein n=1 Tax=Lucifera butyrica TaxID=1351585 RepID=A0A498RCY6_9FIRM|nr:HD domain-containing protein [Lucifera butyrica]VBB07028.1 Hypothetical protein LUCI_2272 [Lucifera butyrica]
MSDAIPGRQDNYREFYRQQLERHFGSDRKRINHALKVLAYAEKIMCGENVSADLRKVITITALLHDVGIKPAEEKYHSSAGNYQEIEGPPVARQIMRQAGEPDPVMERVAYIIGGHHTPSKNDGLDFQIILEADLLVNIEEEQLDQLPGLAAIIAKNFKTAAGTRLATEQYLH